MAKFYSTKTYGTDRGLSCCFRQWRATHSHCSLIHGYSIGIRLIFESDTLDEMNWVMDFGGLKAFKDWADWMFDHTLIVANDDPEIEKFKKLDGVCDLRIIEGTGCEKFAETAYSMMNLIITNFQKNKSITINGVEYKPRYQVGSGVRVKSVEVFEHAGNSAIYEG